MAHITLLQTWWRRLLTRTQISSLRLLDARGAFEEFAEVLGKPATITTVTRFLGAHGLPKVSPRLYLAAFMIYHWGDEITGVRDGNTSDGMETTPEEELSWAVRREAKRLVRLYSMMIAPSVGSPRCIKGTRGRDAATGDWDCPVEMKEVDTITHTLRVWRFKQVFDRWKVMDKKSILDHMCYNYTELSNCRNMMEMDGENEYGKQILEYIEQQQSKIKRHIESLAGQGAFDTTMQQYRPVRLSCTYGQMREIMQRAFWDKVTADLSKTPPDHKHVMILFDEVKTCIQSLIPRRKDMHEEMRRAVDTPLINQMIENNAFDHKDLSQTLGYLIEMIRQLEPPIEDEDTDCWLRETQIECDRKEPWKVIVPKFFKKMFSKIEGIRDSVEVLHRAAK